MLRTGMPLCIGSKDSLVNEQRSFDLTHLADQWWKPISTRQAQTPKQTSLTRWLSKMAENLWSILCTRVCVDQRTNLTSIHEVIEQITISSPETNVDYATQPAMRYPFEFVSLWRRSQPE